LDASLNEVRLLSKLVTDFLNFARPQDLNLSTVDLRLIVEASANEIRPQLANHGIEVVIEGAFPRLAGDESLLRRALVNLFRNAAEAIDPRANTKTITITGAIDTGLDRLYAHIRVSDTGTGISPEDLPRIFIPFFTTKSRGYGIGLALVQKILVAHGGDVSVESSDKGGTVFHCRLPLLPPTSSREAGSHGVAQGNTAVQPTADPALQ
jgi:signal transduction histidine kinase